MNKNKLPVDTLAEAREKLSALCELAHGIHDGMREPYQFDSGFARGYCKGIKFAVTEALKLLQ